ncbi:glycosyl transferase family 2 [Halopiger aswanensis]|uniref:Glycosyl transferase family 2 n=1 Tax=Halopiger aswanensis TaxID=148449 RepID=A0A3R7DAR5_9EURY|nr:glycosyl transferase family 2 [Halopiger aswanensis]
MIFFAATAIWIIEVLVVGQARKRPGEYDHSEIHARVLTIDAQDVVQGTVDSLPDGLGGVQVIAEREIDVDGATVHVVPEEFTCEARRKARAVEWARRNAPVDEEFVLYLDEDTIVPSLPPFPDVDVVQLMERPVRTGSWLCYFAEIFRMGFQIEQRTFPRFCYPLYAWGGGFAVKANVENEVTWDVPTVTEDTNFIWRAFADPDREMAVLPVKLLNQAPPSIRAMITQRRRWISGAALDSHLLPRRYRALSLLRNAAWGLVVLSPLLLVPAVTPVSVVFLPGIYQLGILVQVVCLFAWGFLGYWYYAERFRVLLGLFLTLPVVAILHAAGAFWAIVRPTSTFEVTPKVPPTSVTDEVVRDAILDRGVDTDEQPRGEEREEPMTKSQ